MTQPESRTSSNFLLGLDKIFLKMANISKKDSHEDRELKKLQLAKDMEIQESILKKQNQAQKFIDVNLWKHYFKMIENGYIPTAKQINNVDLKLSGDFMTTEKPLDLLNELLSVSYEPSPAIIIALLRKEAIIPFLLKGDNLKDHLDEISQNTNIEATQLFQCYQAISNSADKLEFSQYCGKLFLESLDKIYNNILEIDNATSNQKASTITSLNKSFYIESLAYSLNHLKFLTDIFPQKISSTVSLDDVLENISKFNDIIGQCNLLEIKGICNLVIPVQNNLETLINYYSTDLEIIYNETKQVYSDNYLNHQIIETNKNLISHLTVDHLPKETQKLISQIQLQYKQLKTDIKLLEVDNQFIVNNLFDKKVPEVLQKYLSIPEEYRSHTNLENKDAQTIMNETLINYSNKLTSFLDIINDSKIKDLSVMKRYSKSI